MKPTIGVISPSSTLTQMMRRISQERQLSPIVIEQASQENALHAAEKLISLGAIVLISRGNTANILRKHLHIPIVDVQHTFFDCYAAYQSALHISDKIAFLGTSEGYIKILNKSKPFLENVLIFPINPLLGKEQTAHRLDELSRMGIKVAIGGLSLKKAVEKRHIHYVMSMADKDAINDAIDEACHLLKIEQENIEQNLQLKSRYELINVVLNGVSEGIINIDPYGIIQHINGRASELLSGMQPGQCIDTAIGKDFYADVLQRGEKLHGMLLNVHNISLIMDMDPIKLEQKTIGAVITLQRQTEIQKIEHKMRRVLAQKHYAEKKFDDIIGCSQSLQTAKKIAARYAAVDSTILIVGETGTGKELFAQSIHNASPRCQAPFVAVNCAAFPPSILESELFGYVKGAFTGALNEGKPGIFELAHTGTIFLDEISETSLDVQLKLLRVIQERKVIRIGDNKVTPVDIRIITSTNKNLAQLVRSGSFREDFFYRICVLQLRLPPLRERQGDVPQLTRYFLRNPSLPSCSITEDALTLLSSFEWRGNIRQLGNIVERLAVLCDNATIDADLIRRIVGDSLYADNIMAIDKSCLQPAPTSCTEKELIYDALHKALGNRLTAAQSLGISTTTLWRKMKKVKTEYPHYFDLIKYK
jgi:transcriptional regulator with PAS, ATPase and Fis domain